jgi:hypothetical protein
MKRWPRYTQGLSVKERFWSKVDKNGPTMPHMKTRCWVWIAGRFPSGYGCFGPYKKRQSVRSHRVAWELTWGSLGKKKALHHCDNPPCCRPSHIYKGTDANNMADKVARGRARGAHKGSEHHNAKLTDLQVQQIRRSYIPGRVSQQKVADKFNISREHVRDLLAGKYRSQ